MKNNFPLRIIARLDLKEEFLIKGIYFEGLKKIVLKNKVIILFRGY